MVLQALLFAVSINDRFGFPNTALIYHAYAKVTVKVNKYRYTYTTINLCDNAYLNIYNVS